LTAIFFPWGIITILIVVLLLSIFASANTKTIVLGLLQRLLQSALKKGLFGPKGRFSTLLQTVYYITKSALCQEDRFML